MAATAPQLDLSDAQAKKIVKLAIENGAYSDDMPDDKKGRLAAAQEAVEFCIDSWVNDGVRPDDDDEDIAAAGEAIQSIFEAAGIEIDDEGNLITPDANEEEDDDEDGEPESDDEEAFNPDDYIEGWSELGDASKVKALKELDLDDEDTLGIVQAIHEWENEQKKPSSRALSWIEDNTDIGEGEADADDDSDDDDSDDDNGGESEAEAMEEPWEGYDKATAVDIKKVLDETEDLEIDQVEYVKEYEEAKDKPRKRVLDKCDELIEALSGDGSDDDSDDDDDDEPVVARSSGSGKNVGALGKAKAAKAKASNGTITLTREQILEALTDGEVEIAL